MKTAKRYLSIRPTGNYKFIQKGTEKKKVRSYYAGLHKLQNYRAEWIVH